MADALVGTVVRFPLLPRIVQIRQVVRGPAVLARVRFVPHPVLVLLDLVANLVGGAAASAEPTVKEAFLLERAGVVGRLLIRLALPGVGGRAFAFGVVGYGAGIRVDVPSGILLMRPTLVALEPATFFLRRAAAADAAPDEQAEHHHDQDNAASNDVRLVVGPRLLEPGRKAALILTFSFWWSGHRRRRHSRRNQPGSRDVRRRQLNRSTSHWNGRRPRPFLLLPRPRLAPARRARLLALRALEECAHESSCFFPLAAACCGCPRLLASRRGVTGCAPLLLAAARIETSIGIFPLCNEIAIPLALAGEKSFWRRCFVPVRGNAGAKIDVLVFVSVCRIGCRRRLDLVQPSCLAAILLPVARRSENDRRIKHNQ
mmetsp:Transcript_16520/g.40884  ORF Transcript_16520/g.40884 Transcript_16520/m.40884 type:complete len:373 (-) Transcript_16520:188-1306(-)